MNNAIELIMPPHQSAVASRRYSLDTMSVWAFSTMLIVAVFIPSAAISFTATKTFILAAGALVTLALFILARLSRGNVVLPPLLLVGALCLPAIAYALSAAFSGVPFMQALWGSALESGTFGFMLITTGLGVMAALILRRSEQYRSFLKTVAWIFSVVVLFEALVVTVGQFSPTTVSPAFSILGSFEDLAFFLGFGIVSILIALRFFDLSGRVYQALVIVGIVALALLAVTNSAFTWTLVALVSLGLFVEAVMQRGSRAADSDLDEAHVIDETPLDGGNRSHSLVLPLIVLAISLFFLIGGTLGNVLAQTLHVNILNVRPSWQSTLSVANKVYAVAPVFGTGPGTFGSEWLKYRDASLNSTPFWNIDFPSGIGFIPTSLVTTGLVGALAWAAFLLLFIGTGLRTLVMRTPQDPFIRAVAILSFVAALYLFTTALFDMPGTVILGLAFVCAGLFASTMRYAEGNRQWGVIFARSPRLGFVIVFSFTILLLASVVAAYTLVEHYLATAGLTRASIAFSSGDLDTADRAVQDSILFAPSSIAYQFQADIMNARLGQIINSTTLPPAEAQQAFQTALSSGINAALTATRLSPSDYQNWLALGHLYARAVPLGVSGAYESAKAAYGKAQALNPTNPHIPYIQAQLNIANKDTKAAESDLKAAILLKQDYTAAIFLLSQLEVQNGNVKGALDSALAAAYFTPNDPSILFQVGVLSAAQGDIAGATDALLRAVTANPQFANARYFLAALYAKQNNFKDALVQLQAIAAFSSDNAKAVESQITALEAGRNPFPANLLSIPSTPVQP